MATDELATWYQDRPGRQVRRSADGPPRRVGRLEAQHTPGEETWLVGERRSTGERNYYLSNLPADTPLKDLARAIKARWVCEQAHQQLKEELGLDHFEWAIVDRAASACPARHDALCRSPILSPQGSRAGKNHHGSAASAQSASDPSGHS